MGILSGIGKILGAVTKTVTKSTPIGMAVNAVAGLAQGKPVGEVLKSSVPGGDLLSLATDVLGGKKNSSGSNDIPETPKTPKKTSISDSTDSESTDRSDSVSDDSDTRPKTTSAYNDDDEDDLGDAADDTASNQVPKPILIQQAIMAAFMRGGGITEAFKAVAPIVGLQLPDSDSSNGIPTGLGSSIFDTTASLGTSPFSPTIPGFNSNFS